MAKNNRVPQIPLYTTQREKSHPENEDRWFGLKALFLLLALTMGIVILVFAFQQTNNSTEAQLVQQMQNPEPIENSPTEINPGTAPYFPDAEIPQGTITFVDTTIGESVIIQLIYDTLSYNHTATVEILKIPQKASLMIGSTLPIFLFVEGDLFHFYVKYIYSPNSHFVGEEKISFGITVKYEDLPFSNQTRDLIVRTRISPVFTSPLLDIPAGYTFSETSAIKTKGIKTLFEQEDWRKAIPLRDDWLNRRYNTCAVVGNGGSLRGQNFGNEIDSHDMVIRFNGAPTKGFENDVGSKMTIGFNAASRSSVCWKWNNTYFEGNYEVFCQAVTFKDYQKFKNCITDNPTINYHLISYKFIDLADSIVNFYESSRDPTSKKKYRSTGLMATIAAATVCDHLTLYGFNNSGSGYHHYFDTKKDIKEWSGHSYWAERRFYNELKNGYGAFKNFFYMYQLPKSVELKGQ